MKCKRYSEEQIISILHEHAAGAKVKDLVRKYGLSEKTLYRWRSIYSGMTVSDARKLKALETENARLKKLLADQVLDNAALKELLSKEW